MVHHSHDYRLKLPWLDDKRVPLFAFKLMLFMLKQYWSTIHLPFYVGKNGKVAIRLDPSIFFFSKCLVSFVFCFGGIFDGLALSILFPARFLLSNIAYLPSALIFCPFLSAQPVNLSESLEGVLLSMCEESSQLRSSLLKVLEVCLIYEQLDNF